MQECHVPRKKVACRSFVGSVTHENILSVWNVCMEGSKLGIMNGLFAHYILTKKYLSRIHWGYDMIHFLQTQGSVVAPQTSTSSASKPPHQVQL